jgi:hypothetical protein
LHAPPKASLRLGDKKSSEDDIRGGGKPTSPERLIWLGFMSEEANLEQLTDTAWALDRTNPLEYLSHWCHSGTQKNRLIGANSGI